MPTTVIKSIKPGGGGDYSSLAAWNTDRQGDITAGGRDTIEIAEIYGGGNAGAIDIDDTFWVTDSTHTIIIRAASGHEHVGIFDSSKAYITGPDFNLINIFHVGYITVGPGICVEDDNSGGTNHLSAIRAQQPITLSGLIMRGRHANVKFGVHAEENSGGFFHRVQNCVIYSSGVGSAFQDACIGSTGATHKIKIYNCTLINRSSFNSPALLNITADATMVSQNNYVFSRGTHGYDTVTPGSNDATYNTNTPTFQNIPHDNTTFVNTTFATADYHLANGSGLIDNGFDLTSEVITIDFEGDSRVAPFDIGADQSNFAPAASSGAALLLGVW